MRNFVGQTSDLKTRSIFFLSAFFANKICQTKGIYFSGAYDMLFTIDKSDSCPVFVL